MNRYKYLFTSTKGLILTAISLIAIVTAIFNTLSGPMVEWGIRDITVKLLGMDLNPEERAGRIIMLYHTIAMAVVAIEVYMMTSIIPMRKHEQRNINMLVTIGYMTAMVFGLGFAYWGHNFTFHGLFLVGQSLVFFAGVMLAVALNPWKKEYYVTDKDFAHFKSGMDMERMAFFVMVVAMLISAGFGAVTGSFWSNGHETFLAEDLIRNPHKTHLQKSIIGHLHIMLTLIAVAITLVVGRWLKFKGIFHKIAMPFMIVGTIVIAGGVWSVVWTHMAHTFIYIGSVGVMLAAFMLVIFSWKKLIHDNSIELGYENPNIFQKLKALLSDPIKFGPTWQMVFMNFTVSGIGIFMAIKLEKIFRVWPAREERITLTGHWHILAALIATIIIMYYVDIVGLKGKVRKWFGWILIIGSDFAFASMTIFSMKKLFIPQDVAQQKLVNTTMLLTDFGLGAILVSLAIFLGWKLFDLFQADGLWKKEAEHAELDVERTSDPVLNIKRDNEFNTEGGEK
ncbi:MAG: hypothetical protein GXO49_00545 [Chlorobi bacterium]|nr:hypothetical protein [Chlorobiota bacterium]